MKRPKYYSPNAKLTYEQAEIIREAVGLGIMTAKEAAAHHHVSINAICNLLAYKTYKARLPRTLPPRFRTCTACKALIPDRIDGVRIHPVIWKNISFCSEECGRRNHSELRQFKTDMAERFRKGPL